MADRLPLVSVLITAFARPDELRATLRLLRAQDYPALELLVIDDASPSSLEPIVREEWPDARYLRNARNLGLIASRTLGMSLVRGEYMLTIDDDSAPVARDAIARAVARFEAEPRLGILSCRIHEGIEPPTALAPLGEQFIHSYVGCGHMMRTTAMRAVGGYRDYFVYYGEESEFAMRLLDQGWYILLDPSIVVHHRLSPVGRSDAKITAYNFRNTIWTVLLDVPFPRVAIELAWKLFSNGLELAKQGNVRWAAWAVTSCLAGLPRVLRDRRPLSRRGLRTYDALRFRRLTTVDQLQDPAAPSLAERWRWFWNVWRHRRRARAFWDRTSGGVGRAAWTPADADAATIVSRPKTSRP